MDDKDLNELGLTLKKHLEEHRPRHFRLLVTKGCLNKYLIAHQKAAEKEISGLTAKLQGQGYHPHLAYIKARGLAEFNHLFPPPE